MAAGAVGVASYCRGNVRLGADLWSKRGDPRLHELAQRLSQTEAKFYGAYWCPNCMEQNKLFSGAAEKLPYVECSPGRRNSPMTSECVRAGVLGYPTWVINGKTHVGVVQPTMLAVLSGYDWNNDKKEQQTGRNAALLLGTQLT